jgi:hypothetical protein
MEGSKKKLRVAMKEITRKNGKGRKGKSWEERKQNKERKI